MPARSHRRVRLAASTKLYTYKLWQKVFAPYETPQHAKYYDRCESWAWDKLLPGQLPRNFHGCLLPPLPANPPALTVTAGASTPASPCPTAALNPDAAAFSLSLQPSGGAGEYWKMCCNIGIWVREHFFREVWPGPLEVIHGRDVQVLGFPGRRCPRRSDCPP
jgi:hypothetical protein